MNYKPEIYKFIENAISSNTNECIIWPYSKIAKYPFARLVGRVHRYVCFRTSGPPVHNKLDCAHECNNALCINPKHLRWDTRRGNMQDMVIDGTDIHSQKKLKKYLSSIGDIEYSERHKDLFS